MNIKYDSKAKLVTITFGYDPGKAYPVSKTGKSRSVESSHGFVAVPGTVARVSLNAINPVDYEGSAPE